MMHHTLLLRFSGWFQAYSTASNYDERPTERQPTKSAVLGALIWMGPDLDRDPRELSHLRVGVRVDREPTLYRDFQTVQGVPYADRSGTQTVITRRGYLCGGVFVVGLEGDDEDWPLLEELAQIAREPRRLPYLGRFSCVPTDPIALPDGLRRGESLAVALRACPWLYRYPRRQWPSEVRVVMECAPGEYGTSCRDVPIHYLERQYGLREVRTYYLPRPERKCHDTVLV